MPIIPLLNSGFFDPEATKILTAAYDTAWQMLRTSGNVLAADYRAASTHVNYSPSASSRRLARAKETQFGSLTMRCPICKFKLRFPVLFVGTESSLPHSRLMEDTPRDTKSYWRILAQDADHRIARATRTSIGSRLREIYSHLVQERLPPKIADLLGRLDRES